MQDLTEFIQEKYSPAFNKKHGDLVQSCMKLIDKAVKEKSISKEDAIAMIEDLLGTYKKEYNL